MMDVKNSEQITLETMKLSLDNNKNANTNENTQIMPSKYVHFLLTHTQNYHRFFSNVFLRIFAIWVPVWKTVAKQSKQKKKLSLV